MHAPLVVLFVYQLATHLMGVYRLNNRFMSQVITEQFVKSSPNGLQMMYAKVLEFVPHHCRLLREVTGGTVSRYDVVHHIILDMLVLFLAAS